VRIKALCKRAGIARLDGGPRGATVQFHNDRYASPAGLVSFLNDQKGAARVRDNRIVIQRDWPTDKARLVGAFGIVRDLAALAKPEGKTRESA
jgi:transcription-repair coupling factor (superfamily II helicase)